MALDLSKLARLHDFDLETEALGIIRCGTITLSALPTAQKLVKEPGKESVDIVREVLGLVGKQSAVAEGDSESAQSALTDDELQKISDSEVELFAQKFYDHNEWLRHSYDDESRQERTNEKGEKVVPYSPKIDEIPKDANETASHYLVRVLDSHFDKQNDRLKKMLGPSLLGSSALMEQYKKLVEPLSTRMAADIVRNSAIESLRKNFTLSDQLQESIKAIKQNSIILEKLPQFDAEPVNIQPIKFPENPIVETNRQLRTLLTHIGEMRSLATQSAELIGNMNDTALQMQVHFQNNARSTQRSALLATAIAVFSLIASSVFSWLSYSDGKDQSKANDVQIKLFQGEVRNLIEAQNKDREVLAGALKDAQRQVQDSPVKNTKTNSLSTSKKPK